MGQFAQTITLRPGEGFLKHFKDLLEKNADKATNSKEEFVLKVRITLNISSMLEIS